MSVILKICKCITGDSVIAVETLRAELARAKEQARMSNAAVEKIAAELKVEQTARCYVLSLRWFSLKRKG